MGTFKTSKGERLSKANIDANIRVAKSVFCMENVDKQYCWTCGTTCEKLSCSHIISVNRCQNDGKSEAAWDTDNLEFLCIPCHVDYESTKKLNPQRKKFIEKYNNM